VSDVDMGNVVQFLPWMCLL